MAEISQQFETSLNKLKEVYLTKIKEEIPYYKNVLKSPLTKEILEELRMKVHKLRDKEKSRKRRVHKLFKKKYRTTRVDWKNKKELERIHCKKD